MHRALRDEGIHVSRKRVARIMRQKALVGRCRRRFTKTTISDPDVTAADLLKRAFGPGTVEVDRVYVGDITYIWTWEGWLYLATVIDLASRKVVGWAMAEHMRAELVCDALRMAIGARRPAAGSDLPLRPGHPVHQQRVHRPAGRARDASSRCPGPASAGTTRWRRASSPRSSGELVDRQSWATRAQVRREIVWYIEVFFNRKRLHSSLGYLTPVEYEATIHHHKAAPGGIVRTVRQTGSTPVSGSGTASTPRRTSRDQAVRPGIQVDPRPAPDSEAIN